MGKRWRGRPEVKRRLRELHLRSAYGMTLEAFEAMHQEQRGCCYLCDGPLGAGQGGACVDHSHKTGAARRLLCSRCNINLGVYQQLKDSGALQRVIEYLALFGE